VPIERELNQRRNIMQGIRKTARILFAGLLALGVLALQAPLAEAAAFVKFDGIDGEAKDANHDKWIDVLSVDWGTNKPSASVPGERLMQPKMGSGTVTITKRTDKASPALTRRKKNKRRMKKVILDAEGPRGGYVKYELINVMITSFTSTGRGGRASETITLNYEKIRVLPAPKRMPLKRK
jgi:type VI secretion system secreted protein Hcp